MSTASPPPAMGADGPVGDVDTVILRPASRFHGPAVLRRGSVVHKAAGPQTATVHSLLRHLERVGFSGAPRVVGSGFDEGGRQTLSFVEGASIDPGPWTESGAHGVGTLLRQLHRACDTFVPPVRATWGDWFGRYTSFRARQGHGTPRRDRPW